MTYGLLASDPLHDDALRSQAASLINSHEIPFGGFTDVPAPLFNGADSRQAFLFRAAFALMQPGQPIPADMLVRHLSGDAQPGNVLRHYACLQLSLLPYLRPGFTATPGDARQQPADSAAVGRWHRGCPVTRWHLDDAAQRRMLHRRVQADAQLSGAAGACPRKHAAAHRRQRPHC